MSEGNVVPPFRAWSGDAPLALASKSPSRRALLAACGLEAETLAVDLDERDEEDRYFAAGGAPEGLARRLACAKAFAASAIRRDAYCLAADQTLTVGTRLLHKARDRVEAAQSLAALAGRTHRLTSAFCVARAGRTLVVDEDWPNSPCALSMRRRLRAISTPPAPRC